MKPGERVAFLVAADAELMRSLIEELVRAGKRYQLPIAASLQQARERLSRISPTAILIDESALSGAPIRAAAEEFAGSAPVVVLASPSCQAELAPLIATASVDFVARTGSYVPVVAALLGRQIREAERREISFSEVDLPTDFGELLRHEVNNPLTGILGNAEILLARRDRLPAAVAQRLETIADLAVRLRETIRRLSWSWEGRRERVHSA
jgi:signal transduction histidine kinase